MAFCPNLSNPEVKREFDSLIKKYGENRAYYLWDKYRGTVPANIGQDTSATTKWFTDRFGADSVFIKESLANVFDVESYGYVAGAAAYLDSAAPLDTKYHEGFHLLFRSLLNDAQRQQLYTDARAQLGEPTIQKMDELANLYPNAEIDELENMALEEAMAEEFRTYAMAQEVPTTIKGKLVKFFKDLVAFIKAMMGKPLTMQTAFRLLESNKIPNKFVRNAEAFEGPRAYMIKEFAQNREMHKELVKVAVKQIIDSFDAAILNAGTDPRAVSQAKRDSFANLLGNSATKSSSQIADMFLKLSISNGDASIVSNDVFFKYKELYSAWAQASQTAKMLQGKPEEQEAIAAAQSAEDALEAFKIDEDLYDSPPAVDQDGNIISAQFDFEESLDPDSEAARLEELSKNFKAVYKFWYDSELPSGRVQKGFRSEIIGALSDYGIKAVDKDTASSMLEDEAAEQDRVYSRSRMQESHVEKLSAQQKILLSRIPVEDTSKSFTGLQQYVPAMDVYKSVLEAAADKGSFAEMLDALEQKSKSVPHLAKVYDFVNNLPALDQARFYDAFNLSANEFVTLSIEGGEKGVTAKIFSPNVGGVLKAYEILWKNRSTTGDSILTKKFDSAGNIVGFQVNPKKVERVKELMSKVGIDQNGKTTVTSPSPEQQADFARLLMLTGFEIAENETEAINRVQDAMAGKAGENVPSIRYLVQNEALGSILRSLVSGNILSNNPFENEGTTIRAIINAFVAPFEVSKALSFVNLANKSIYPINLKGRINDEKVRIKNNALLEDITNTLQHDAIGKRSILHKLLSSEEFIENHSFQDVDGIKAVTSAAELEDLTKEDVYSIKFNQWAKSKNFGHIITDTQGDRKRMVGGMFPKLGEGNDYGIFLTNDEDWVNLFIDEILLDLNRMSQALTDIKGKDFKTLIPAYHYREKEGKKIFSAGGWTKFNITNRSLDFNNGTFSVNGVSLASLEADFKLARETGRITPELQKIASDIAQEAYSKILNEYTQEVIADLGGEKAAAEFVAEHVDSKKVQNPLEFIQDFVKYDYLARHFYRQMFRDGVNFVKDGADYIKRAQLITTPGHKGVLKGELSADPEFGLSPTFNAATINDVLVTLPEDTRNTFKKRIMQIRDSSGRPMYSEAAAERIVNSYVDIESTDAQSFITVEHAYELHQFRGRNTPEMDAAFQRYKDTGVWDTSVRFTAMKPSWDGRIVRNGLSVPYSDKTSYIVLTPELVAGIPVMQNLLRRMEAKNEYQGLEQIQVVQTVSSQKLAQLPAYTLNVDGSDNLSDMVFATMDSQYLRFPEDTPMKKDKEEVLLGRQQKVNLLTNLNESAKYYYNSGVKNADGTSGETGVTGRELKNIFHKAIKTKLDKNLRAIYEEVGYQRYLDAATDAERQAAIDEMIPKIRDLMVDMSLEKDFNNALEDALSINPATGKPTLPLGYASIQGRFDQVLFSIFRNRAYQQRMKGMQMVQFADIGNYTIDSTLNRALKFIEVDGDRVAHAEVDLRADFLERAGVDPEVIQRAIETGNTEELNKLEQVRRVIAYRIPQQGKSSSIIFKIRRVLPMSHDGVARVPAGITTMMGSDFDIDKMFFLFPELETVENENGEVEIKKVAVPYNDIIDSLSVIETLEEAQLNNILFDTFEAVLSSVNHVHETFTPIDGRDLKVARNNSPFRNDDIDVFSTKAATQTFLDNMLSHRLRGAYANAVLGRNAVMGANLKNSDYKHEVFGLEDELTFIDEGQTRISSSLQYTSLFTDVEGAYRPTDYFMSLHLGAAVDSVKDPLQAAINDNGSTAKLYVYLYSKGLATKQAVAFMNHPVVRYATSGESISASLKGILMEIQARIESGDTGKLSLNSQTESIASRTFDFELFRKETLELEKLDDLSTDRLIEMYYLIKYVNAAASDLGNLYRTSTPFTIDKSGTTAQNIEMLDEINYYLDKESSGSVYGDKKILPKMLRDNKYESSKAYYEAIARNLDLVTKAGFVANQPALSTFRQTLAGLRNGEPLEGPVQELVLRMTRLHLATRPGSALYEKGFLDESLVEQMHLSASNNIHEEYKKVKAILKQAGVSNSFIEALEPKVFESPKGNLRPVYYMEFNNTIRRDNGDQDAITAAWEALYFNTANLFGEAESAILKRFAEQMITNTILTTGMTPGPFSVAGLIPPLMLEELGVAEDYYNGLKDLDNDPGYLVNNFLQEFIETFGHDAYRRQYLVKSVSARTVKISHKRELQFPNTHTTEIPLDDLKYMGQYVLVSKGRGYTQLYSVERGQEAASSTKNKRVFEITLTKVPRRGVVGEFYEFNLRGADGSTRKPGILYKRQPASTKEPLMSANEEQLARYEAIYGQSLESLDPDTLSQANVEVNADSNEETLREAQRRAFEEMNNATATVSRTLGEEETTTAPVQTSGTGFSVKVTKVISGGQTGADRIGLEVAKELGIPTGGIAPKGYRTEDGSDASLRDFGLLPSSSSNYADRTEQNVLNSDGTVLFGDMTSAGSKQTIAFLKKYSKPYIENPTSSELVDFLAHNYIRTLNVAGNRGSKLSREAADEARNVLKYALTPPTSSEAPFSRVIDALGMRKDMPKTLEQKINRLTKSFAAAGINVDIVLDTLPQGVKGMVEDGVVYLDPNQVTEDTAYHELGHILVDMLPKDEVDRYIRQIIDADPNLAEMVADNYPELSGKELGKEILVTAIGMEGAKIERRNPSRLQVIINRILRAIGRLFGITPNAAAVLAERMFAGDIKVLSLDGRFDKTRKMSVELQDKLNSIYQDAYEHLERRLRDLKYRTPTDETTAEKARIIAIQETLKKINENKASVDAFLQFSLHVSDQVRIMERALAEIEEARNKPVDKDDALFLLRKVDHIREQLSTLYNTNRTKSVTDQITKALTQISKDFDPEEEHSARVILADLQSNLMRMQDFERRYLDNAIPLVADVYTAYQSDELDRKIQNTIDSIVKLRDTTINIKEETDPKILEVNSMKSAMFAEGREEEWEDMMINAKVDSLRNRKSGRENIINELRSAYRDKSLFSLYLDPLIYSNQNNLQLFAITFKDHERIANQKAIAKMRRAEEFYNRLKAYKGSDFNKETFYDDFLEIREVIQDGKPVKVLSIVQPFLEDYQVKKGKMYVDIAKKYNRPESGADPEVFQEWAKSDDGKAYKKERAAWFAANSVPVPDAAAKYKALSEAYADRVALVAEMRVQGNLSAVGVIENEMLELRIKLGSVYDKNTNTYMGDLAMPNNSYVNPRYTEIVNNPALKEFYDFIVGEYKESQRKYGRSNPQQMHSWDEFSYIAPSVRQGDLEALQRKKLKGAATELFENLKNSDTDQELYGAAFDQDDNPVKYLPRYFTNVVDEKYISRDLLSSVLLYGHKAVQYEEKAKLTGLVNAMLNIYERREVVRVDDTGRTLLGREAARVKEAFQESFVGDTIAKKVGDKSNTYNHLSQFIDVAFYGILKKPTESKLLGMDPNKVAVTLNSLSAMGSLSFNTLQIGNQFIMDNLMQRVEGVAGDFFSNSDLQWARFTYASVGGGVRDLGAFAPKTKLGKLAMHFDALVDINDNIGRDASGNKFLKAMSTGSLFALQGSVEFQTATTRMLAAMKATEGQFKDSNGDVILNSKGKEANLWDLMIETENGVELDPRVDTELSNYNEGKFIAKLHGLSKRTNQIKGNFDSPTISRGPLGILLMLYKSYFIPGFRKHFGHGQAYHVDNELDGVTRGIFYSYLSFLKLVRKNMKNGGSFREVYTGLSDTDKANIKRFHAEAVIVLSAMAIYSAMSAILDDDDDDENYMVAYMAYQARRLQTELLAFTPVIGFGEAIRMFKSPLATANRAEKVWDFVTHLTFTEVPYTVMNTLGTPSEDLTKAAIYQRDSYWGEEGDRKSAGKLKKILPIFYGASTFDKSAIEDKLKFFQ